MSNSSLFDFPQLPAISQSSSAAVKFDLFVKSREIKQINQVLTQVSLLSKAQRAKWFQENEDILNQLVESFMTDTSLVFEGVQMDGEAIDLSVQLVTSLRDVLTTLNGLAHYKRGVAN